VQPLASGHRCHHFWQGGSESMVGTPTGVLPCLWCGLKGAPLYLGDSGDADDKNHGMHLMVVLGRPTYVSTALGAEPRGDRPAVFELEPLGDVQRDHPEGGDRVDAGGHGQAQVVVQVPAVH
jgi:hypothetical protein